MYTRTEKKQFILYLLVAYGVTALMGLVMWYGYGKGVYLGNFASTQMLYPAAGVALAFLLTAKKEEKRPKAFYWTIVVFTLLNIGFTLWPVFHSTTEKENLFFMAAGQYLLIAGTIVYWIVLLLSGKEKREAGGLRWHNTRSSWFCILLFAGLYFLRFFLSAVLSGEMEGLLNIVSSPMTWIALAMLPVNFFLVMIAFLGEEYGWRYYMQPFLQKRFGIRGGVILLGVLWGLWHAPINFFYYTTPQQGLISMVLQQSTCIFLGIFFAYAYMKTENIWVPVILHYLNNNLIPIMTGVQSASVLEHQQVSWSQVPAAFFFNFIFYGLFLFLGPFKKEKEEKQEESQNTY